MATNQFRWLKNLFGLREPLIVPGLFAAGSTQAVAMGEILELTASTATEWVPMDSDFAMDSDVAVAAEEIKAGDRAGYYGIIVPRPGDVFWFELDTANNPTIGTSLYWSSSEEVSESGTNILGVVAGWDHYPAFQGHLADDAAFDRGTTIKNTSIVQMTFREAVSYWTVLQNSGV